MLLFSKTHEWVEVDGNTATIGITDHAQEQLGDIVYVQLPEVDDEVSVGDTLCEVESVKAVSEIFAPVNGRIVEVNEDLEDSPEMINEDAMANWICKIELAGEAEGLMSEEEYEATL